MNDIKKEYKNLATATLISSKMVAAFGHCNISLSLFYETVCALMGFVPAMMNFSEEEVQEGMKKVTKIFEDWKKDPERCKEVFDHYISPSTTLTKEGFKNIFTSYLLYDNPHHFFEERDIDTAMKSWKENPNQVPLWNNRYESREEYAEQSQEDRWKEFKNT